MYLMKLVVVVAPLVLALVDFDGLVALGGAEGYAPASAPELLDLYYMQSEAGSVLPPEEERAALAALTRN